MFKLRILSLAVAQVVATGALSMLAATPAMAQQTSDNDQAGQVLQRVEITGSSIRRVDAETADPIQILTAQDLKNSGYTSVNDVLQHITSNGAGTLTQNFTGGFAAGGAGISLHGLNDNATLTLIDGHRMAPYALPDDGSRSFVDISNIPFDAIERIEILKDGASAVYGSDAMAGVVNIILKKNIVGTTVAAESGSSTEGGGTTSHASLTTGMGKLNEDGYNAYISMEYRHQDPIYFSQRQGDGLWQNMNWAPYGGVNNTAGVITKNNPTPGTLAPYLINPNVSPTLANGQPNPAAFSFYQGTQCSSLSQLSSGGCAYVNPASVIQTRTENLNLLGSFTKKLADDWQLDIKASMFESKDNLPQGLNGVPSSFNQPIAFSSGVLPHLIGTAIPSITVPATYPGNPFGVAAHVSGPILGAPERDLTTDSKSYRLVADLTGTLGAWDIDASVGYSKVNLVENQIGNENVPALYAALNRSANPLSLTGPISPSDMASIFSNATAFNTSELDFGEVHASRSLAQLPGGDFVISTGGQYIHRDMYSPGLSWCGNGSFGCSSSYVMGSQTDVAAYMEFLAPVLKTLEIDGAVRYDHISDTGNATTPKLGFKYTPSKAFAIRGTVSKGFRAPAASENGDSATIGGVGSGHDPVLCAGGVPATGNIAKGSVISSCNESLYTLAEANPSVGPERSTSETLGVILEPVKGWSTAIDLYSITIKDQIVGGPSGPSSGVAPVRGAPVQTLCADGNGGSYTCTPNVGPILYYPGYDINSNQTQTKGLELDSRYRFNLGAYGKLTTDLQWSHAFSYVMTYGGTSYELAGTHGPGGPNDDSGNPKDRIQFTTTWDQGPWQVATTLHWTSGFNTLDQTIGVNVCGQSGQVGGWFPAGNTPQNFCQVGSFLETDLSVQYKLGKQWTFHGSVSNLFNQAPPVDVNTYGSGRPYDLAFSAPGAIGRFVNAGVVYKF